MSFANSSSTSPSRRQFLRQTVASIGLLGMPRLDFIKHASKLGIPYIDMTSDEWEREKSALDAWPRS